MYINVTIMEVMKEGLTDQVNNLQPGSNHKTDNNRKPDNSLQLIVNINKPGHKLISRIKWIDLITVDLREPKIITGRNNIKTGADQVEEADPEVVAAEPAEDNSKSGHL